jgi:deoxyribodipyrimidine photolyase-related protein
MWTGEATVYHSRLSAVLNLKLLTPKECVDAALEAYRDGAAPLNAVEGFVRQLIGWREFIRGVYWLEGPDYGKRNALECDGALPEFYWTGDTDLACLRHALGHVLDDGYGHHIQRLMITGNFALLCGVHPKTVSDWYLGMYVDGVDWVTLPNTLGMAMHADGGVVGTKPYSASGKYIKRMSNYCDDCRYDVKRRTGDGACPFNTLYWDFLIRHRERFRKNNRMAMILKNVDRLDEQERVQITVSAKSLRKNFGVDAASDAP